MQIAILILTCIILALLLLCVVGWLILLVYMWQGDREARQKLFEQVEYEKRVTEQKERELNRSKD